MDRSKGCRPIAASRARVVAAAASAPRARHPPTARPIGSRSRTGVIPVPLLLGGAAADGRPEAVAGLATEGVHYVRHVADIDPRLLGQHGGPLGCAFLRLFDSITGVT